ncbi:MAG: hypothetical protein Q8R55_01980 [Candidatus Taylorbacteria bacterium]|nr:hypothetical protein [Candidatus Taylorbacteria bacterium]
MSHSTLTLEKERTVQVPSLDLIGDGSREMICRKLSNLQKENKEALTLARQESMVKAEQSKRRDYAKRFISRYTKMFGISREGLKDLVKKLKDEEIVLLENTVLERLKKPAIFEVIGSFSLIITFIGCSLGGFLSGNTALIGLAFMMLFTATGWLLPFMFLVEFFYGSSNNGEYGANTPGGYFGSQRLFKNKYGPKYFPYQEFREELGLIEKQDPTLNRKDIILTKVFNNKPESLYNPRIDI